MARRSRALHAASGWVLPARAGMARLPCGWFDPPSESSPRTRGDGPYDMQYAPDSYLRCPRTRGDGPLCQAPQRIFHLRSPRTRGDGPVLPLQAPSPAAVLPARAGMARDGLHRLAHWIPVLPARAGMARSERFRCVQGTTFSPHARGWPDRLHHGPAPARRSPRTRGDGPGLAWVVVLALVRSPRTRGDGPRDLDGGPSSRSVLPARAGMARSWPQGRGQRAQFSPHARGWPDGRAGHFTLDKRSPRTRGDGPHRQPCLRCGLGFSPHARGWPVVRGVYLWATDSSPRTRGDGPVTTSQAQGLLAFSPHARGWPVGARRGHQAIPSSPRTRGDGPPGSDLDLMPHGRSPRTRGDGPPGQGEFVGGGTVLPARAGMAQTVGNRSRGSGAFSPHARGWPGAEMIEAAVGPVLPARAGMARPFGCPLQPQARFSPHARGWPVATCSNSSVAVSTPRTRGDGPATPALSALATLVLPARAGMARRSPGPMATPASVLPARAGMAR